MTQNQQQRSAAGEVVRQGHRPLCWEDDLSVNTLDDRDFEVRPPICDEPPGKFNHWRDHIPEELIAPADLPELIARDRFPIPSPDDREGYTPDSDIGYWLSGLGDCLKVMGAARDCGVGVQSLLDFGCASGRVTRHFCIQRQVPEVWGTDVNRRHIRWLCKFMPRNLLPVFVSGLPSLPMPDSSVDAICAFSVFTHIDTFETAWLAELRRVLRPGGLCYVTVHNEDTWAALRGQDPSNRLLQSMINTGRFSMDMLDREMPDERLVYRFSQTGPYRSQVFHSSGYLERTWGRFMELQDIKPCYHNRQSVVLMTRPKSIWAVGRMAA